MVDWGVTPHPLFSSLWMFVQDSRYPGFISHTKEMRFTLLLNSSKLDLHVQYVRVARASWWIQGACLPFARWPLGTTAEVLTYGKWLRGIKPPTQKVSRFKNGRSSCQFYCNCSKSRYSKAARQAALIRREWKNLWTDSSQARSWFSLPHFIETIPLVLCRRTHVHVVGRRARTSVLQLSKNNSRI